MKRLAIAIVSILTMVVVMGCRQPASAELALKEGISYSVLDSDWENVSLIELYKISQFSLNAGMRDNDTVLGDIGYDLNKLINPLKVFVEKIEFLKPITPILNLINPSLDVYAGVKRLDDQTEFDWGFNIVAISIRW